MAQLPLRTVGVIGAVCVTVGWLLASTLTPPVARVQSLPARAPKPPARAEQPAFTEQLHLRLLQTPAAPSPRRNPFVFGQREPRVNAAAPVASAAAASAPVVVPQPVPVGPAYTLAGIGISGDVRTAILTDGQAVHVVKAGDQVGGYDIVEVSDNSVTLGEVSGLRYVLRLR